MSENKCQCGSPKRDEFMQKLFDEYLPIKDNLIQMLNEVQEHYGYIPQNAQIELSEFLNIPMAEIYGVITFYSRFTLKPLNQVKQQKMDCFLLKKLDALAHVV